MMPYRDPNVEEMEYIKALRYGTYHQLRYSWFRWFVERVAAEDPQYTEVAGPFWRKRTAEVALKLQEALHGRSHGER